MSNPVPINITILDKEYKVACPPGEQSALLKSADYLDQKMREVRDGGKIIGSEKVAVIAALNIAHELLTASSNQDKLDASISPRLRTIENKVNEALQQARQLEI